ncbi:MAG: hypothetical protein MJA30_12425 [Cytophagales bacterium]|nr:hypothetical protein [Cytophagales bacterium]
MDISELDKDIIELIERKSKLGELDYNSSKYDELEEELHDLEDGFLEKYGDFLEDVLHEVHDEYCPDNEVLLPIAYIPSRVTVKEGEYDVPSDQGVYVEADDYESNETKLVLLPSPTRVVLLVSPSQKEVVWTAKG